MGLNGASGPNAEEAEYYLMESLAALPGTRVQVKEGHPKPELVGMFGVIERSWGNPDYAALDVRLEDGHSELFWFHQLDSVAS